MDLYSILLGQSGKPLAQTETFVEKPLASVQIVYA